MCRGVGPPASDVHYSSSRYPGRKSCFGVGHLIGLLTSSVLKTMDEFQSCVTKFPEIRSECFPVLCTDLGTADVVPEGGLRTVC